MLGRINLVVVNIALKRNLKFVGGIQATAFSLTEGVTENAKEEVSTLSGAEVLLHKRCGKDAKHSPSNSAHV